MTTAPCPSRSLGNEIARALMEGYDPTWNSMRSRLEDATVAVEAVQNYLLVFGPDALIEGLTR